MEQRLHLPAAPDPAMVLFNDRCRFDAVPGLESSWVGSPHQGLGLFLVIDRFVPNWAMEAFGPRPKLGIDLLREAVAAPPPHSAN